MKVRLYSFRIVRLMWLTFCLNFYLVEENEDEADDRSELDVDEETRQFIEIYDMHGRRMSPSIPELDRDNEDILMIQYSGSENGTGDGNANHGDVTGENSSGDAETNDDGISGIATAANEVAAAVRSGTSRGNGEGNIGENSSNPNRFILHANFIQNRSSSSRGQVNAGDGSAFANGGEGSSSSIGIGSAAAASSTTTSMATRLQAITSHRSHMGTSSQSQQPQTLAMRARRTTRRGRGYHYINLNRSSNPPVILQRLLGPGAQNIGRSGSGVSGIGSVSLTTSNNGGINSNTGGVNQVNSGSSTFRDATRVVVMDNGFGIFTNNEEGGSIDLVDQAGFLFGRSLAATLNNTPSALHWWLEEAKVLGLESQSDVCLTVCNSLIPDLETQRSLELSQMRNGKRKKRQVDQKSSQAKKHHHEEQFSATERLEVQQEESVLSNYNAGSNLTGSTQIEIHATDVGENDATSNRVQGEEAADNDSDSMSSDEASLLLSVGIISSPRPEQDTAMNVVQPVRDDYESENEVRSQSQMSRSSSLTMSSSPISPNEGTSDSDEVKKASAQQVDASSIVSGSGTSTEATKDVAALADGETPKNNASTSVADELLANTTTRNIQDEKVCDPDASSNTSEEDNAVVTSKTGQNPDGGNSNTINVDDSDDECCVVEAGSTHQGSSASKQSSSLANDLPTSSISNAVHSATQPEAIARPPGLTGKWLFYTH